MICSDCDQTAVYEVREIVGTSDPANAHYGLKLAFGQCREHMARLVATTDKRYEIKSLVKQERRQKVSGEQIAWDF